MKLTTNQEAWLQALESGNYVQGDGWLKKKENGLVKHCCLGVWAEMCLGEGEAIINAEGKEIFRYGGSDGTLAEDLWKRLGLRNDIGILKENGERVEKDGRLFSALTDANDHGVSFQEIAQFCRENPEAVFVNNETE